LWQEALDGVQQRLPLDHLNSAVDSAVAASGHSAWSAAVAARIMLLAGDFGYALRAISRAEALPRTAAEEQLFLTARAFARGMLGDFAAANADFENLEPSSASLVSVL